MNDQTIPETTDRLCHGCDLIKPMRKRQKRCDDCKAGGKSKPRVAREQVPHETLLERPPSFGFKLLRQEGDYVFEQETPDGVATIWLSPEEADAAAAMIIAQRRLEVGEQE